MRETEVGGSCASGGRGRPRVAVLGVLAVVAALLSAASVARAQSPGAAPQNLAITTNPSYGTTLASIGDETVAASYIRERLKVQSGGLDGLPKNVSAVTLTATLPAGMTVTRSRLNGQSSNPSIYRDVSPICVPACTTANQDKARQLTIGPVALSHPSGRDEFHLWTTNGGKERRTSISLHKRELGVSVDEVDLSSIILRHKADARPRAFDTRDSAPGTLSFTWNVPTSATFVLVEVTARGSSRALVNGEPYQPTHPRYRVGHEVPLTGDPTTVTVLVGPQDPAVAGTEYTFTITGGTAAATETPTETTTPTPTETTTPPTLRRVGFAAAAYSGTEGDTITIGLRLAQPSPWPVRLQVRPTYGSTAKYDSDYSLGDCLPGERSCDFGVGLLDVEIPAGETAWSYDIRTEDDHRVEGDETFTLDIVLLSRNAELGDHSQAVITIKDNDQADVVVSEESIAIDEDTSGSYTVKLTSQPAGWVRIYAESAFACKVNVSPGFVEFGPRNWNQPQTFVHVRSWNDYDAADEEVVISHRIETASNAAEYRAVDVASVTVNVEDKHSPSVIVERTSLQATVGGTARYRVYLDADPSPIYGENPADCYDYSESHTVTIAASSSDTDIATVSPASVTFTADDYDPKTFTVSALSPGNVAITHTVSGTDPDYTDGTIITQSVAVTVPAPQQAQESAPQQAQEPATMQQLEVPGAVGNVRLEATADSVSVSWDAPASGGAPKRYIVHLAPVGAGKGKGKTKYPKATKLTVTFRNLEAGSEYRVWVRAQNKAGKGERAQVRVTLPEAGPAQ